MKIRWESHKCEIYIALNIPKRLWICSMLIFYVVRSRKRWKCYLNDICEAIIFVIKLDCIFNKPTWFLRSLAAALIWKYQRYNSVVPIYGWIFSHILNEVILHLQPHRNYYISFYICFLLWLINNPIILSYS